MIRQTHFIIHPSLSNSNSNEKSRLKYLNFLEQLLTKFSIQSGGSLTARMAISMDDIIRAWLGMTYQIMNGWQWRQLSWCSQSVKNALILTALRKMRPTSARLRLAITIPQQKSPRRLYEIKFAEKNVINDKNSAIREFTMVTTHTHNNLTLAVNYFWAYRNERKNGII